MKQIITLITILIYTIGYSQDISVNTGVYNSLVYAQKGFPSYFKYRGGHGYHINLEYNKMEYSTAASMIYGLEWKQNKHEMYIGFRDENNEPSTTRNGTYTTQSVSFLLGGRLLLNSKKKFQYKIDGLLYMAWNYKSTFKGSILRYVKHNGGASFPPSEEYAFTMEAERFANDDYTPINIGATLRAGIAFPIKEKLYLNVQGFISPNVFGSVMYSNESIHLSLWNYGLNVGLTFE